MAALTFWTNLLRAVTGNKITAALFNGVQDAVQTEFETRDAPFTGHLVAPTLAIDAVNDRVNLTAGGGLVTGKRVGTTGFWSFGGSTPLASATGYRLYKDNTDAFLTPTVTPNSSALLYGTCDWDGNTLTNLAPVTTTLGNTTHTHANLTDLNDYLASLDRDATKMQGRAVASTAPSDGQTLVWDNAASTWKPGAAATTWGAEQSQDAVGNILTDSDSIDFTYNDAADTITAAIKPDNSTLEVGAGVGVRVKALGIGTSHLAAAVVTKDKLAADTAGAGLAQNADGSLDVTVGGSLEISGDAVQLVNDGPPTAGQYYGTDGGATPALGWHDLPAASANADQLQGVDIAAVAPADGQILAYDAFEDRWEPRTSDVTDVKDLMVSGNDTTPGYLADKVAAGDGISLSVANEGVDEDLTITNSDRGSTAVTSHEGNYDHSLLHARQHSVTSGDDHTFPGGTTDFLRADGTFAAPTTPVDIHGATETTDAPDGAADELLVYDSSAGANRRILINNLAKRKETLVLGAGGWPAKTSGCAALAQTETTGLLNYQTFDFDASTSEVLEYTVAMPSNYDGGTVTARFYWKHEYTTTNFGVTWQLQATALSDTDDIHGVTWSGGVTVTDTGAIEGHLYISPDTTAYTIAGTPAAGDMVQFRVARLTTDAGDTLAVDAKLLMVVVEYSLSAWSA